MLDFHNHSTFSPDGKSSPEENIKKAIENGVKTLCFTDHLDYEASIVKARDWVFDIDTYFKSLNELKEKYEQEIDIRIGVEVGMQPHLADRLNELARCYPFDFIIGSIHSVRRNDLYTDPIRRELSEKEMYDAYYDEMYDCVLKTREFNCLGHMDYLDRLYIGNSRRPNFQDNYDHIKAILSELISSGRGIEVNTSGKRYGLDYYHPKVEVLKLYKSLGGEIISLGSDAHKSMYIGEGIAEAIDLLVSLGYKYIFEFKAQKAIPIHI